MKASLEASPRCLKVNGDDFLASIGEIPYCNDCAGAVVNQALGPSILCGPVEAALQGFLRTVVTCRPQAQWTRTQAC